MVGAERCRAALAEAASRADAILVEGVMGLYDGTPSAADLSREFGLPVLAVIDAGAHGADGRCAGARLAGLWTGCHGGRGGEPASPARAMRRW